MKIITARGPGTKGLARVRGVNRMARQRLKWMDYYGAHHNNATLTCRYFGISRQTFYRWKRRYDPTGPHELGREKPQAEAPPSAYLV